MPRRRGAGFGDFLSGGLSGLGSGLGSGVHNLLGNLFGGARKRKVVRKAGARSGGRVVTRKAGARKGSVATRYGGYSTLGLGRARKPMRKRGMGLFSFLGLGRRRRGGEVPEGTMVEKAPDGLFKRVNRILKDSKIVSKTLNEFGNPLGLSSAADVLGYGRSAGMPGRRRSRR